MSSCCRVVVVAKLKNCHVPSSAEYILSCFASVMHTSFPAFLKMLFDVFWTIFGCLSHPMFVPSEICHFRSSLLLRFVPSEVCHFQCLSLLTFVVLMFVFSTFVILKFVSVSVNDVSEVNVVSGMIVRSGI